MIVCSDQLRRVLRLPAVIAIEYKRHQDSLVDKSSYRNPTMVWRAPNRASNPDKPHGFGNYGHHNNAASGAAPGAPGGYQKAWKPRNEEAGNSAPNTGYRSQPNAWGKPAELQRATSDGSVPNRGHPESQEAPLSTRSSGGGGGWQRGQGFSSATSPTAGSSTASPAAGMSNATAALQAAVGIKKTAGAVAPPIPAAPAGNAWARKGPTI
jgi:hypothetical protein